MRPHAVTEVASLGWSFDYDPNGNMITRTVDGGTYRLTYNAENKLATAVGPTQTITYILRLRSGQALRRRRDVGQEGDRRRG